MDNKKEILAYCKDIAKGKILSGTYCKKAVKRFMSDLKRSETEEGYPYFMDWQAANDVIDFAECLHIPDINTNLKLFPFQKFLYANVWGWKYKDNKERRRFRTCFIEIARKNSKTTSLLFPFILYDALTTNAAESYFVSATGEQAEKSFTELSNLIKETTDLKDIMKCYSGVIVYNNSRITFFSSETKGADSYKNSFSVVDEFHSYESDKIITAFRYGSRARLNGTVCIITSAGLDTNSPCFNEVIKTRNILDGALTDDSYFGILYEYDEKDDWKDKRNFIKANPALGTFLKEDVLLSDLNDAIITPSHQKDFISKTCGLWDKGGVSDWLNPDQLINKKVDFDSEFNGCECYGGLDLSSVSDLTVYSLCFEKNGNYYFKHRFFIPSGQVQNKYENDSINFQEWINKGLVIPTPGQTIDYDFVIEYIKKDSQIFRIKEICFDPWQSKLVINKLNDELPNITYIEFAQNLKNFSEPTKNYEKKVLDGHVIDSNPIARWNLKNCVIKVDPSGNYKPLKSNKSSTQRIDGIITSIMALSRACYMEEKQTKQMNFSEILNSF
jgi:phage terminase|nr:MAG TPA: Large Terminase [Caudoviricetes sp.]